MKKRAYNKTNQIEKKSTEPKVKINFWGKRYFFEILLFSFTFLLYANSIRNDYNLDDELVTINHRLTSKGVSALPEIFASPYYQDESGYSYEYRPVVLASFAIEHEIFGDSAHWSHFWNLLLYSLTCILLYRVLLLIFKKSSYLFSFTISLLFAVHSAHTEVVCSIKNRDEILALFFSLLSFSIAMRSVNYSKPWSVILLPVFFTLALMSKVSIASFVVIIPVALILLTDASLGYILVSAFLLLFPTFILLKFGTTFDKIILVFSIFFGIIILHSAIHFSSVYKSIKDSIASFYSRFFVPEPSILNEDKGGVSFFFKSIIPNKNILSPLIIAIVLLLLLAYYWGSHHHILIIILTIPILLFILHWKGNKILSWWAAIGLYLCICFSVHLLESYSFDLPYLKNLYSDFLLFFCIYQLYYGNRYFFIPILIGLSTILFTPLWLNVLVPMFFFGAIYFKWIRYILFAASMISLFLDSSQIPQVLSTFIFPIILVHLRKDKYIKKAIWIYPLTAFALLNYFSLTSEEHFDAFGKVSPIIIRTNKINTDIVSLKQNRPLEYVEECVRPNDSLTIRAGTSMSILLFYLQKVIVPYPMSFYYGYKFIYPMKISDTIPVFSLIVYLLLIAIALCLIKRNPIISFGLIIYLSSIFMFANYLQPIPGMIADRFLLVPSLGFIIILVAVLFRIFDLKLNDTISFKNLPIASKCIFFSILLLYSSLSFSRCLCWKNYLTLFEHDIEYVDNSAQAQNLLAVRLIKSSFDESNLVIQNQMRNEAAGHFRRAIEIYPQFFNATYDLGRTYYLIKKEDSAVFFFKKALKLNPGFVNASLSIGDILMEQHKLDEAKIYYKITINYLPQNFAAYDKLIYIYSLQKDITQSINIAKTAIAAMPKDPQPYILLAKIYHNAKMDDSSAIFLRRALVATPNNQEALKYLKALGQ